MFGLAYLIFFALYLLVSLIVVIFAVVWAGRYKRNRLLWGGLAALLMYNLVFWDWVPTVVMHDYYCEKEAGFWVYKTIEQWKAENPGVMDTLVANKDVPPTRQGNMENYTDTYLLNPRIKNIVQQQRTPSWLSILRYEEILVDRKTNEVLARYVDFGSYNREWGGLKFWTSIQYCSNGVAHPQHQFYALENQLIGRKK